MMNYFVLILGIVAVAAVLSAIKSRQMMRDSMLTAHNISMKLTAEAMAARLLAAAVEAQFAPWKPYLRHVANEFEPALITGALDEATRVAEQVGADMVGETDTAKAERVSREVGFFLLRRGVKPAKRFVNLFTELGVIRAQGEK